MCGDTQIFLIVNNNLKKLIMFYCIIIFCAILNFIFIYKTLFAILLHTRYYYWTALGTIVKPEAANIKLVALIAM